MNPAINLLSGFRRVKSEEGIEHYAGSLNLKSLKKVSDVEIEVVLLSTNALPKSLTELMKKGGSSPDLLMFAESKTGK